MCSDALPIIIITVNLILIKFRLRRKIVNAMDRVADKKQQVPDEYITMLFERTHYKQQLNIWYSYLINMTLSMTSDFE